MMYLPVSPLDLDPDRDGRGIGWTLVGDLEGLGCGADPLLFPFFPDFLPDLVDLDELDFFDDFVSLSLEDFLPLLLLLLFTRRCVGEDTAYR
jgi:hypothetical protein